MFITKTEIIKAYFNNNAKIPHIKLIDGKQYHNVSVETFNNDIIKIKGRKAPLEITDIDSIIIPQHSKNFDNVPFRELVCQKATGKTYDEIRDMVKYHSDKQDFIGSRATRYLPSKPTMKVKTINNVEVRGVETYGTLTDISLMGYHLGDYYSSTSSKWGAFGNGLNTIRA